MIPLRHELTAFPTRGGGGSADGPNTVLDCIADLHSDNYRNPWALAHLNMPMRSPSLK